MASPKVPSDCRSLCLLLAVSAGLSVVHGAYDTGSRGASNSGSAVDASVRSGLIRNQDSAPNDSSRPVGEVSISGGESSLAALSGSSLTASSSASVAGSVSNLGGASSQDSSAGFARSASGTNSDQSFSSANGPADSFLLGSSVTAASSNADRLRIVNSPGSFGSGVGPVTGLGSGSIEDLIQDPVTITRETTVDVFKTITNIFYNSVPITLTEFIKTTEVAPTLQVLSTPVDDLVFVATAPVTRTDTVTVTNTNTGYLYATEVSTDVFTVTHKAYDIRQKLIISTILLTQVFHPTIVRTRINTEYDTQTVEQTVFNTIVIQPRSVVSSNTPVFTQTLVSNQQFGGQGQQQFGGQGQQLFGGQFTGSQSSGQLSNAQRLAQRGQQLLNLQLPVRNEQQDAPRQGIVGGQGYQ